MIYGQKELTDRELDRRFQIHYFNLTEFCLVNLSDYIVFNFSLAFIIFFIS
ncbi:hypothetical protein ICE98_01721 [Lactococcus lactis]|nr:hypothetical protein [Lactococcus lactis]